MRKKTDTVSASLKHRPLGERNNQLQYVVISDVIGKFKVLWKHRAGLMLLFSPQNSHSDSRLPFQKATFLAAT